MRNTSKIFGRHENLLFYPTVVRQVSNYRSEYAYNAELSWGTIYLTQLFSQ